MDKFTSANYINSLSSERIPFLFIIDFSKKNTLIYKLDEINPENLLFNVNGKSNHPENKFVMNNEYLFKASPISFKEYSKGFDIVMRNLRNGNSYLTNYTAETPIETNLDLQEVFIRSKAKYKLWVKDLFTVFSPEPFIKIEEGKIYSFPMKGTIDASIKDAENKIINNPKESAEHATITDLIRNDLSRVSTNVKVERYRYIEKVKTNNGELLQVSSKISGELPGNYLNVLGNIIFDLLPAGSISGAPKAKTVEIIKEAEPFNRGFFTGVFGIFDGNSVDCGVMIRFIENKPGKLVFKSGGGITINSNAEDEYEEMIKKVYLSF